VSVQVQELELHRVALTGHCYRMLGSSVDADDAVQEALIRAWKSLDRFDGRSSMKTWLYRIATNVCLDAISDRKGRVRPIEEGPVGTPDDTLATQPRTHWLEPIADERAVPTDVDPAERLALRQSIRLAFVAALQHLPPKQRAALLFTDVLGFSAAEAADSLDMSIASVNSAIQRARATLSDKDLGEMGKPLTDSQTALVDKYCEAFLRYDVSALTSLLHDDAKLSMPPFTLWLQGTQSIARWLDGPGAGCRDSRLARVEASGAPAFAQWRKNVDGAGHKAWAILVLELRGDRVASMTSYLDVEKLFPLFGLPIEFVG